MVRDTIQLEDDVSTISLEYLREFVSEYYIPEDLHPELPGPKDTIVDVPEGKVGVYTKFFEFANFRVPISQLLFDILGHFQIHFSQLSVLGAAKMRGYSQPSEEWLSQNASKGQDAVSRHLFCGGRGDLRYTPHPYPKTTRNPDLCYMAESEQFLWTHVTLHSFMTTAVVDMDLFNLISAPNPTKERPEARPGHLMRCHQLTANANQGVYRYGEDTGRGNRDLQIHLAH
ncbi:hypothetical protein Tco_0940952 [Tanacetum coccineum]|uniref:Uncharacterized protein n=1 Tax=Tanacetum coccineum TaxID=301880 RepID=A0ABQ5DRR4_9ASTR